MLVPGAEERIGLGPRRRQVRNLRGALDEPVVEHVPRHFRVELDAPRALAEPEGLARGVVLCEQHGALQEERTRSNATGRRRCCAGRTPRTGSASPVSLTVTRCQPTSDVAIGPTCAPIDRAISWAPRHTPRSGTSRSIASRMNASFLREPRVLGVLVGMHRAAEDHDRVVAVRLRRAPTSRG